MVRNPLDQHINIILQIIKSVKVWITLYKRISSANIIRLPPLRGISASPSIQIQNRSGPNTEPCGTPDTTSVGGDLISTKNTNLLFSVPQIAGDPRDQVSWHMKSIAIASRLVCHGEQCQKPFAGQRKRLGLLHLHPICSASREEQKELPLQWIFQAGNTTDHQIYAGSHIIFQIYASQVLC